MTLILKRPLKTNYEPNSMSIKITNLTIWLKAFSSKFIIAWCFYKGRIKFLIINIFIKLTTLVSK